MITTSQFCNYLYLNIPLPVEDPVPQKMRLPNYDSSVTYDEFMDFLRSHVALEDLL